MARNVRSNAPRLFSPSIPDTLPKVPTYRYFPDPAITYDVGQRELHKIDKCLLYIPIALSLKTRYSESQATPETEQLGAGSIAAICTFTVRAFPYVTTDLHLHLHLHVSFAQYISHVHIFLGFAAFSLAAIKSAYI